MKLSQALAALAAGRALLVSFAGKYSDDTYVVRTEAELRNACCLRIMDAAASGYFERPLPPGRPSLTTAEIATLPKGAVRDAAEREREDYEQWEYADRVEHRRLARLALRGGELAAAYTLLNHRYEGFDVTLVERPNNFEPFQADADLPGDLGQDDLPVEEE